MKKRYIILAALLSLGILGGCGDKKNKEQDTQSADSQTVTTEEEYDTSYEYTEEGVATDFSDGLLGAGGNNEGHYTEVNKILVDNEYVKLTVTKIYDKGYLLEDAQLLPDDYQAIEYTVTSDYARKNPEKLIYLSIAPLTINGEGLQDLEGFIDLNDENDYTSTSFLGFANIYMSQYSDGDVRDAVGNITMQICMYTEDEAAGTTDPLYYEEISYDIEDTDYTPYKRKAVLSGEQVILDNEKLKVTYLGSNRVDSDYWQMYYIENKTDDALAFSISPLDDMFNQITTTYLPPNGSGYHKTSGFSKFECTEEDFEKYSTEGTEVPVFIYLWDYEDAPSKEVLRTNAYPAKYSSGDETFTAYRSFYCEPQLSYISSFKTINR